jgi:hypothetical protein
VDDGYAAAVRRLVALLVSLAGCGASTEELALRLEDGGCTAEMFEPIAILSIDVYGNDEDAGMCALSRRCLFDVDMELDAPLSSIDDMEAVLRAANQPLIDIEAAGANYLKIVGRRNESGCWSGTEHPACGTADLADADGDELPVTIRCDTCLEEDVPLCP